MIMTKPTIAVLGALGGQGGSVVNTFLKDQSFNVRGVTRSTDSDAAKSLQARGVEIIPGNVKEPKSLTTAFEGAAFAFVSVNFWDPEIMTNEGELTKKILDVAKDSGIKHLIFSSLANVGKVSDGQIHVPHFTLKAEAWEYAQSLGFDTITAVEPAAYYSNWFTFFKPAEEEDGSLVWTWPGKKGKSFSQFDVKTGTGPSVLAAAKDPEKYNGKSILLEADLLTVDEIVAMISKKLGKSGRVKYEDPQVFSASFPGAHELSQMVKWFDEYGYYGPETEDRNHGSGKKIGGLVSFQEWLDTKDYENFM
ncbi:MAG: hypothetical protein SGILL_002947 [Bacillariaceae sp.]